MFIVAQQKRDNEKENILLVTQSLVEAIERFDFTDKNIISQRLLRTGNNNTEYPIMSLKAGDTINSFSQIVNNLFSNNQILTVSISRSGGSFLLAPSYNITAFCFDEMLTSSATRRIIDCIKRLNDTRCFIMKSSEILVLELFCQDLCIGELDFSLEDIFEHKPIYRGNLIEKESGEETLLERLNLLLNPVECLKFSQKNE